MPTYDEERREFQWVSRRLRTLGSNIRSMTPEERTDFLRHLANRLETPEADTKVRMTTVLDRVLSAFSDKLSVWEVEYVRSRPEIADRAHLHLERAHPAAPDGSTVSRIDVYFVAIDGFVNTLSAVDYRIWTNGVQTDGRAENLGDVIVTTYNATNWPNPT